jgi:pimeloyl-ACP methyl ester carboxylesterase
MAALLLSVCASGQQVAKSLTASNGVFVGFLQYTPTNYNANPTTKYPLIIFLHGIGERGDGTTQLQNVAGNGIPRYIKDGHTMTFTWNGKTETFLVLSPQLSGNYGWWQPFYVDEMIKYAKQNLRIDTNRIILTGLSLGGGGVWYYAANSPTNAKTLAAIAPVCGTCQGVNWCNIASANLPTWAFHATDDGTVSANCTNGAIQGIENCNPAVKPYKTIWPTGQHWIWDRAFDYGYGYQNPNVYEWWLAQDKSKAPNKRPVANAGSDINVSQAAGSATLNGTQSTDADGTIVRYVWSFVSGPSTASVTTPTSTSGSTTVTGLTSVGTYVFELKAVDDRCDWSTARVNVNVGAGGVNSAPVTIAGPDITITLPTNSTTLNGTATYDKEGYVNSYQWTKVSGPSQFSIANTAGASTALTNLVEGTYVFKLTAWDNQWANSSDEVTVVVKAESTTTPPPTTSPLVANAGSNVSLTLPSNSTTLNGSGSTGKIIAYSWSKVSGPAPCTFANANAATTMVSNLTTGTYNFSLQVTDSSGATSTATVVVIQNAAPSTGNQPAIPVPGADMTITLPVNSVTLNGTASYDPDGAIKAYQWSKVSGPSSGTIASATAASTTASNLVEGVYKFKLMVWGDNWVPMAAEMQVTVKASTSTGNVAPIANAGADATITLPTNSFSLNGTASNDPDGTIAAYAWSQVSGPSQITIGNASTVSASAGNLVQGTYSFRLQVTDNAGAVNADTIVITVKPAAVKVNQPPVANAGADLSTAASSITLSATGSYDPDGVLKAYLWLQIGGPNQSIIATQYGSTTTVSNLVAGTYKFQLMVWGDDWMPRADTIVVTVSANAAAVTMATAQRTATVELAAATTTEKATKDGYSIYPNPATSQVTVQYKDAATGNAVINMYDVTGKLLRKQTISKQQSLLVKNIDVAFLRPGIYHLELVVGNKRTVQSFVKQ